MQTSSPSYLLMASLDAARHQAVQPSTWTEPIRASMRICEGLCNLPGITLLEKPSGVCSSNPFHSFWQAIASFALYSTHCRILLLQMCLLGACHCRWVQAEILLCLQEL